MRKIQFGNKTWLAFTVLMMAAGSVLSGIGIYLLKYVTDFGLARELDKMVEITKIAVLVFIALLIVEMVTTWVKATYLKKSLVLQKNAYISKLMEQDITQLQKEKESVYRSNLTNDFDRFEDKFLKNLLQMLQMALQFIMAVVLISTVSLTLVVVAFGMLVLFVFITSRTSKPVEKSEAKKSKSLQAYTDFVSETLSGFEIIKQHQLEKVRHVMFVKKASQVQHDNYEVDVKSTKVDALNMFIQTLVIFVLIITGIIFAKSTNSSLGNILVVAASFSNVIWPLQQFSPKYTEMRGIIKVLDVFDQNLNKPVIERHIHVKQFESLVFKDCDLGYADEDKTIVENVNLVVNNNEKVLIVGASGAGKSTILKTIRQSIQPKEGQVLLNGFDIYDVVPIDYYSIFSTVDQIGFIFNGTIQENITLFQPLNENKLEESLDAVGLSDLDLDLKLQNNGSNISGGQRARLMLARALNLNSQVILCDEIFASLHQSVAHSIENDILHLDKTIINVSHIIFEDHLALYDKIYIVEDGIVRLSTNIDEVWDRMVLSQNT